MLMMLAGEWWRDAEVVGGTDATPAGDAWGRYLWLEASHGIVDLRTAGGEYRIRCPSLHTTPNTA